MRRLKSGVTFEQFKEAWLAEADHFGVPIEVNHARSLENPQEIVSYSLLDATVEEFMAVVSDAGVAEREGERHDRIDELLEATVVKGFYELVDTTVLT